jgi:hypothetical protein
VVAAITDDRRRSEGDNGPATDRPEGWLTSEDDEEAVGNGDTDANHSRRC